MAKTASDDYRAAARGADRAWYVLDKHEKLKVGGAASTYNGEYPTLFCFKKTAYIALGCRVFTLREAFVHWRAVYAAIREDRYERARAMVYLVLPKAARLAKARGWKVR